MRLLLFFILAMLFTSCGHYSDGTSIWASGAWILLALPSAGAVIFFWVGYKASQSGSKINPIYGGGEGGNVPFWQTGWPILGAGCVAWLIFTIIHQMAER